MIRKFALTVGALVVLTLAFPISAPWLLAHPVQMRIGNPPNDLNAKPVISRAIQVRLSTVGGAQSGIRTVSYSSQAGTLALLFVCLVR